MVDLPLPPGHWSLAARAGRPWALPPALATAADPRLCRRGQRHARRGGGPPTRRPRVSTRTPTLWSSLRRQRTTVRAPAERQDLLVYPGGAREVLKRTTDARYASFWGPTAAPRHVGFARIALRAPCAVAVVPIVGVGWEDMWECAPSRRGDPNRRATFQSQAGPLVSRGPHGRLCRRLARPLESRCPRRRQTWPTRRSTRCCG